MTRRTEMDAEARRLLARAVVQEALAGRRYDRAHVAHVRLAESGWTDEQARTWFRAWAGAGDRISALADRFRAEAEDILTELADTALGPDDVACTYSAR